MFLLSGVVWSVKVIIIRYLHATPREHLPTSSGTNLSVCRLCMSEELMSLLFILMGGCLGIVLGVIVVLWRK